MRYGAYLLTEILGVGGTATVFRAKCVNGARRGEDAALKVMHEHLTENDELVHAFKNEADLLRRLQIPGIPKLYESGEIDEVPYLATELLHGMTLGDWLTRARDADEPRPVSEVVFIVSEVAKSLGAAYVASGEDGRQLELVHRDVSPQNIFLTTDGRVVILDFGIARTADVTRVTKAGTIKGKIAYMAPEQVRGGAIDQRTDVFALGVVLWECLAGRPLFLRNTEVLTAVAVDEGPIPAIRTENAAVSEGLASMLHLALERNPERRFSSADALGVALEATLKLDRAECCARIGALVGLCVPSEHDTRPAECADIGPEEPTDLEIPASVTLSDVPNNAHRN